MAYCPNCGTEYEVQPQRCQCGYLFGAPSAPQQPPASSPGTFGFTGNGAALLLLYIKLVVFSIFTLGIYSFWGRTEIRRYLWSNIRFAGQNFDYHGTGKELFFGWLKLIALFIVFFSVAGLIIMLGGKDMEPVVGLIYLLEGTLTRTRRLLMRWPKSHSGLSTQYPACRSAARIVAR